MFCDVTKTKLLLCTNVLCVTIPHSKGWWFHPKVIGQARGMKLFQGVNDFCYVVYMNQSQILPSIKLIFKCMNFIIELNFLLLLKSKAISESFTHYNNTVTKISILMKMPKWNTSIVFLQKLKLFWIIRNFNLLPNF